jgi:hypothetical protein
MRAGVADEARPRKQLDGAFRSTLSARRSSFTLALSKRSHLKMT